MNPSRRSQHRKVYFGLSVSGRVGEAEFDFKAASEIAMLSWMKALISPAWSVLLKARNSIVPFWKTAWRFRRLCVDEHNLLYAEYKNYAEKLL